MFALRPPGIHHEIDVVIRVIHITGEEFRNCHLRRSF